MRVLLLHILIAVVLSSFKTFSQTNYFSVDVTTTKYSCIGGTAKINVTGGQAPYFYNWNHGVQGEYQANLLPANYNVSIVDGTGRDTVIQITIEEEKCKVGASEAFSPNGDDINDTWSLSNIKYYPNFTLEIFNRWGQLVHQQKNEFKVWDGKQFGIDLPIGTYYYIFFYEGKSGDSEHGSITLMR
jgi:gliding motility-associated-like protein